MCQVEGGQEVALKWVASCGPVLWLHHCGGGEGNAKSERVPGNLPLEERSIEIGWGGGEIFV